jgi:CheY-like chemotaxis protein
MITSGSLKSTNLLKILKDAEGKAFTGTVTLKGKTGLASITLKDGKIVFIREPRIKSRLGRYLVGRNVITEKELQNALNAQKKKGGSFLGEILIEQAVIEKDALDAAMMTVAEESLIHLLSWDEGLFSVEEEDISGEPIGDIPYEEMAKKARQLASAVEDEWTIDQIVSTKGQEEVVLMVEDELLMREMFRDKLISFGFEVDAVESPRKALEKLSEYEETGKIPIVLADLIMPTLTGKGIFGGLELLEEIQKTYSHIPVIVNTAYPDASIRRRALFLGATYYINKPDRKEIGPDELETQLNLFIEEVAVCIQNVIQRHEVYFERDQQNIGEVVQRDTGDIKFLSETSYKMVRDKSLSKMAEIMVNFAAREMDRCAIFLVRKDELAGFYGGDRRPGGEEFGARVKKLSMNISDSPIMKQTVESGTLVTMTDPGDQLGDQIKELLGDPQPEHTVIIPILVQNMVVALLYSDVIPGGTPPRDIDSLEILLNLASLSLEIQQQQAMLKRLKEN